MRAGILAYREESVKKISEKISGHFLIFSSFSTGQVARDKASKRMEELNSEQSYLVDYRNEAERDCESWDKTTRDKRRNHIRAVLTRMHEASTPR